MALVEVQSIHGPMLAFEDDYITSQILRYGAHTRPEIAFLLSIVGPGDTIFDLGAHIGTYAVPLARKAGRKGKLLAVEAHAEIFRVLESNLQRSGFGAEVSPLNALIGHSGKRYKMHTPEGNTGGTHFVVDPNSEDSPAAVTIDELCRRYFTPRIIKMDIEGGELSALASSEVLLRARPIVYAEVNRKALSLQEASIGDLEALFRGEGYRLFRNVGERRGAHDNFVVAELGALPTNKNNFDVLAVHCNDSRLAPLLETAVMLPNGSAPPNEV